MTSNHVLCHDSDTGPLSGLFKTFLMGIIVLWLASKCTEGHGPVCVTRDIKLQFTNYVSIYYKYSTVQMQSRNFWWTGTHDCYPLWTIPILLSKCINWSGSEDNSHFLSFRLILPYIHRMNGHWLYGP